MKLITTLIILTLSSAVSFSAPAPAPPGPAGSLIVDVRTAEEFAAGHIPGAVLFPYDDLPSKAAAFEKLVGGDKGGKDRPIVVYCRSGRRSAIAARELKKLGFRNVVDFGAIDRWKGHLEK